MYTLRAIRVQHQVVFVELFKSKWPKEKNPSRARPVSRPKKSHTPQKSHTRRLCMGSLSGQRWRRRRKRRRRSKDLGMKLDSFTQGQTTSECINDRGSNFYRILRSQRCIPSITWSAKVFLFNTAHQPNSISRNVAQRHRAHRYISLIRLTFSYGSGNR